MNIYRIQVYFYSRSSFFLIWLHFRSEFRQDRDYEARKKYALFENVRIFLIAMYNKIWISNYL